MNPYNELETRRKELEAQQSQLLDEAESSRQEFESWRDEQSQQEKFSENTRRAVEGQLEALEQVQKAWAQDRAGEQQLLKQQEQLIEEQRAALSKERESFEQQRLEISQALAEFKAHQSTSAPAAEVAATESTAAEVEAPEDPDAMRRLRELAQVQEKNTEEAASESDSPANEPESAEAEVAETEQEPEEEDDSIDEYMSQLLARSSGQPNESSDDDIQTQSLDSLPGASDLTSPLGTSSSNKSSQFSEQPRVTSGPRHEAPERSVNMNAMRKLANESTKSAIDVSLLQRWQSAAMGKSIISLGCFMAGIFLLIMTPDVTSGGYLAGAAALVISTYWATECSKLMRHANEMKPEPRPAGWVDPDFEIEHDDDA